MMQPGIIQQLTLYTAAEGTTAKGLAFAPATCSVPANTSAANNGPICSGTTLNLTSSATSINAISYSWAGPNSFTSSSQNPSISNVTTAATGTYTVTFTNSCGTSTASTVVTVKGLPSRSITADGSATCCAG